jgi:hypothetical protein
VTDNNDELGWSDPMVIIGAIALAALIIGLVIAVATGHFPPRGDGGSSITPANGRMMPSGSATFSGTDGTGMPYRNCSAAARDGRYNIHIGDPAYNPALDRNHDGIACER